MIKISIIIPVYNDQYNISECLDSLLKFQKLKEIEVICINDGSTDESGNILKSYAAKYENVILIEQENKGLSAARNAGLRKALGKYVYFVDSDDVVEPDMLFYVWELCERDRLDVLFFSFNSFGDNEEMNAKYAKHIFDVKRSYSYNREVVCGTDLQRQFWEFDEYYPMVWIQVANREFLLENKIEFDEDIIYEDNLYTFQVLIHAKRTYCVNRILYHKRIRENSITTNQESVLSVYSFLRTFIRMVSYFEPELPPEDVFQGIKRIGRIQSGYSEMINNIQKQLIKRFSRLPADGKEALLEKCNTYEKNILNMVNRSISVIVPVFNMESYIGECLASIQRQTIKNMEILVIDDGSTDNSAAVIKEMAGKDSRIQYFYQENTGSGAARNLGLKNAKGDYIAFLDSDDYYFDDDALEKMMMACRRFRVPICGSYRVEMKNGKLLQTDFLRMWDEIPGEGILVDFKDYQNDFFYQSFLYDGEYIRKNNLCFPPYRRYQDPPFLLKVMDLSGKFAVVPTVLHCYRKGHQNYAGNGKYISYTLQGLRDNMLLSEKKYSKLFDKCVWRLENMFLQDIRNYWSDDVRTLLVEIGEIYKRQYPERGEMPLLKELSDDIGRTESGEQQ